MKKKLILLVSLLCMAYHMQAQVRFQLFAGPQLSTANYFVHDVKQKTSYKPGVQAGVGAKIPFDERLFFAPALFYSLKGYKVQFNRYSSSPNIDAADNNTTIHTLETAFLFQYDFGDGGDHFFLKAGPSIDFQLSGKEKMTLMSNDSTVTQAMPYGVQSYGRFAASLFSQFGYETAGGLSIAFQYTHGLTDLSNMDAGPDIRHRLFGISIGKYLGRR